MSRKMILAVLLGALAIAPGIAGAEDDKSLEQLVVETADTKAEHEALANYYEREAADARKLANRHKSMGRAYVGGKSMNNQAMSSHCNKIAEQQEAIAKEYEEMAKMHRDEAKQAKQ